MHFDAAFTHRGYLLNCAPARAGDGSLATLRRHLAVERRRTRRQPFFPDGTALSRRGRRNCACARLGGALDRREQHDHLTRIRSARFALRATLREPPAKSGNLSGHIHSIPCSSHGAVLSMPNVPTHKWGLEQIVAGPARVARRVASHAPSARHSRTAVARGDGANRHRPARGAISHALRRARSD